jgi:hypothetical protein
MAQELLLLDNGGLMDSRQYKQHLRTIKYYNSLVDKLQNLKKGSIEFTITEIRIKTVQGYIDRDLARAKAKLIN